MLGVMSVVPGPIAPDRAGLKLRSGRYWISILIQCLPDVHRGNGICNDQPEV